MIKHREKKKECIVMIKPTFAYLSLVLKDLLIVLMVLVVLILVILVFDKVLDDVDLSLQKVPNQNQVNLEVFHS